MSFNKSLNKLSTVFVLASSLGLASSAFAADAPNLGESANFALLAGNQINSIGATAVSGEIGVNPGNKVTGFPPATQTNGTIHLADAKALQAQVDATSAAISLGYQKADEKLSGKDLGGMNLPAGVYYFIASAQLNGTLTLDAQNNPNAMFIFQVGGNFTTADNAKIELINGAKASNVFFVIGSSAMIGAGTKWEGSLIASTDVTFGKGAKVEGRIHALSGTVTLNEDSITNVAAPIQEPTPSPSATPNPSATPTPIGEEPAIYTVGCDFVAPAQKGKGAEMTCRADGSICVDGSKTPCVTADKAIHSSLKVTCSDSFALNDPAAIRSMNGSTLSLQAKDSMYNAAAIDLANFDNKAAVLQSSIYLTYASGIQRTIAGSCTLK